jgi:hypothetical protein
MLELMGELIFLESPLTGGVPELRPASAPERETAPEPLERLEARLCELAGHLTAATCQFLLLVADFDGRQGWADWHLPSCAAWLSWKCQIAPGTAREQVRVARSVAGYPLIRREFAAGRLSYAKVRALTRIVTPQTEADLVEMATPMTAGPAGTLRPGAPAGQRRRPWKAAARAPADLESGRRPGLQVRRRSAV